MMRLTTKIISGALLALIAGANVEARAADIGETSVTLSAVMDPLTGIGKILVTAGGDLDDADVAAVNSFRIQLPTTAGPLQMSNKTIPLSSDPTDSSALRADFGLTATSFTAMRVWGCAGAWMASLKGSDASEVFGFLLSDTNDSTEATLSRRGSELRDYVSQAAPSCDDFDTELGVETDVGNRLRRYLDAKKSGQPLTGELERFGWLFDALYTDVSSKASANVHDLAMAALRTWIDGLKAKSVNPDFTLDLPLTKASLKQSQTMGPATFAFRGLKEAVPAQQLKEAVAAPSDPRLLAWAKAFDVLIDACVDGQGMVNDAVCGDGFGKHVRWVRVRRSTGDFKLLEKLP